MLTFIVRVSRDQAGHLRGFIERVRTGEKQRFESAESIGSLIDRMLEPAEARPRSAAARRGG